MKMISKTKISSSSRNPDVQFRLKYKKRNGCQDYLQKMIFIEDSSKQKCLNDVNCELI